MQSKRTTLSQYFLLVTFILFTSKAVPIDKDKTKVIEEPQVEKEKKESSDTGLYYDRYLREVIDVLETDKHFREKLQTADLDDIKSGKLAGELDLVSHQVRTKLDELKRQEVARLRMLLKAKMDSTDSGINHMTLLKQFEHLNHNNPDTFEAKDLDMLIKAATNDLENYDKERHDEFKRYEMLKEHDRREYLKTLDEEKRKQEEERYEEMKKKHGDHPKVNHPGSKDQLKEVWEEADGLDPNDFDPKTFFKLHDSNGDGFLDEQELEALFTKELEKVYDPKNEEDDMVEMEEERLRMREHVLNEVTLELPLRLRMIQACESMKDTNTRELQLQVDINHDRLVTMEEFLKATEKREFLEPDSWETLDQQQLFTEEELKEYESHITQQEYELAKKAEELQRQREDLQRQHDQLQAQKQELQQAIFKKGKHLHLRTHFRTVLRGPRRRAELYSAYDYHGNTPTRELELQHMEQKKLQQGTPLSGPDGELKFQPPGERTVGKVEGHPAGGDQPLVQGHIAELQAAPGAQQIQTHP